MIINGNYEFVYKYFYSAIYVFSRVSPTMNDNELSKLLEKYPNKPWDWYFISHNPNITIEMIEKYPENPWIWESISQNSNLTIEMIEKHPDKPWNWAWISFNEFSLHPHLKKNCWRKISKERKSLMDELNHVFDMPPNCSDILIFKKGGYGFHETWRDMCIDDNKW